MAKKIRELYPVRVNVNGKYSHKFKLPKSQAPTKKGSASPLDVARKMKGSK